MNATAELKKEGEKRERYNMLNFSKDEAKQNCSLINNLTDPDSGSQFEPQFDHIINVTHRF